MKNVFKEIKLAWHDKEYTIASDKVMGAIAVIEEHFSFIDLISKLSNQQIPLAKLSIAFADLLKYAGANNVTADEVYAGMFVSGNQEVVINAIQTLIFMMIPPSAIDKLPNDAKKKILQTDTKKRTSRRYSTKRQSEKD